MQEHDDEPLTDVDHVARQLNVPVSWVYSHAGQLGALKVGKYLRFKPSTVERYLTETRMVRVCRRGSSRRTRRRSRRRVSNWKRA